MKLFGRPPFEDRRDAGRKLAGRLIQYRDGRTVVFALPRGGVPVGYEVARALGAPLDVFVSRKLGAPGQPEFGIGAVAPGGVRVLNEYAVRQLGIPEDYLEGVTAREIAEVERRLRYFRGERPEPDVEGRTAILVDDGLATGSTMLAAVAAVRTHAPAMVVVAVPVGARQAVQVLRSVADLVLCLSTPEPFIAVGGAYEDFRQMSDEEVLTILEKRTS
jgi:predicted phosphoribosyltransferase